MVGAEELTIKNELKWDKTVTIDSIMGIWESLSA